MTTLNAAMFQTRTSGSALRAVAILGLCAALVAGFVAQASQAPAPAEAIASTSASARNV